MITFKITCVFQPDHNALFSALFPGLVHDASNIDGNVAVYTFSDSSVTPADLGPLVKIEVIPNP